MPGQSHRERDHYEHQIQVEADVEEAPTKRLRCRSLRALASFATFKFRVLGFIILFILGSILCPIWASGSLFVAGVALCTVPACHIRGHDELTGGSSGHVSVDFPQIGVREIE